MPKPEPSRRLVMVVWQTAIHIYTMAINMLRVLPMCRVLLSLDLEPSSQNHSALCVELSSRRLGVALDSMSGTLGTAATCKTAR